MIATRRLKFRKSLLVFGVMSLLIAQFSPPHRSEMRNAPASATQRCGGFIVAFELSEENGFDITWPHEAMRPAPYEAILIVADKMPRVLDVRGRHGRSRPLLASRHLKFNGQLHRPLSLIRPQGGAGQANQKERFLVRLNEGRLRLTLSIPPRLSLDPQHRTARIKLCQADRNWDDRNTGEKLLPFENLSNGEVDGRLRSLTNPQFPQFIRLSIHFGAFHHFPLIPAVLFHRSQLHRHQRSGR
jgi:hypothetical protein